MSWNPLSWLAGGAAKAGVEVAEGVAGIVEKWVPGADKKHEMAKEITDMVMQSQDSARKHDTPMNTGLSLLDGLVNGVNRLIRPGVTIGLIGGIMGWWPLPPPEGINPIYFHFTEMALIFWFGGRALFKDLPAMLKYLKKV